MKSADRSGADYAVIMGDRDLADDVAQVKDLATQQQQPVRLAALVTTILERTAR
jgi:histidyl-tRNA synthetase